jgi:mannose-6-phosphate isomerase-like protein (cupin superfamily)
MIDRIMWMRFAAAAALWLAPASAEIQDVLKSSEIDSLLARAQSPIAEYQKPNFAIELFNGPEDGPHAGFDEIIFVRHGRAHLSLAGKEQEIGPGDVINIPRGTAYHIAPANGPLERVAVRVFHQASQPPPSGGAPAQGKLDGVLTNAQIEDTLKNATSNQPIHSANNYTMNYVIYNGHVGPWEAHVGCADIYFIRLGTATGQIGGQIQHASEVSPGEIRGDAVKDAREHQIGPGDVVLVPRNTAHHMDPGAKKFGYILVKIWAQ